MCKLCVLNFKNVILSNIKQMTKKQLYIKIVLES